MLDKIRVRVTINQTIGLPHPYWNSLGQGRHFSKLLDFINSNPETASKLPPSFFSDYPDVFNLYIDTVRFRLERHEWGLTELTKLPKEIGGRALIKIGEEKALWLAGNAKGEIMKESIEVGQEKVISLHRSRYEDPLAGYYDGAYEKGSCRHRGVVSLYIVEEEIERRDKVTRVTGFKAERDYLTELMGIFPERTNLFKKMLAELPADKCDIIDTFSFDTRTRTEEVRETT